VDAGLFRANAGSDLASLATRAEDRGDHFVVNGQKTWNSYADAPADWCFLLVRTNPEAPKHQGLSVLLVDMRTPGIRVRPIDTMAGAHEFSEIFFDDVVVPRDCLLGEPNRGWRRRDHRAHLRAHRRGPLRAGRAGDRSAGGAREDRRTGRRPDVRQKLADSPCRYERRGLLRTIASSHSRPRRGAVGGGRESRGPDNTRLEQLVGHVGLELLGPRVS